MLIKDIKDIVLHICAKFDNEQIKDTEFIDKIKFVILQTNLIIEQRQIEILKICLLWIIKDVGLKMCAKLRNNLTKDEGVMVKQANVLPNGLDRRTDLVIEVPRT